MNAGSKLERTTYSDLFFVLIVDPDPEIHGAHPAVPDLAHE